MILEICASNYQSAQNAQIAGADRIELCSELAVGGLTPSHGLIAMVKENLKIPVHVLIRPRSGNFHFSEDDFEVIKRDIRVCNDLGVEGIVSGILNDDFTIDQKRTQELIELSKPMNFTFHRAFDQTPDPFQALEELIAIGADRILSSGQSETAEKGIVVLNQLLKLSKEKIIIMPGSGINILNCLIFKGAGFKEIHTSASKTEVVSPLPSLSMNSLKFFEERLSISSNPLLIQSMLEKINENS